MENNLEGQCSTKSSCKINCKCIITGIVIVALIISTSFLFLKYREQMSIIDQQSNYISKLEMENNDLSSYASSCQKAYLKKTKNHQADRIFTKQSVNYINYNTTEDKYEINVVIPGFKKEDVSIELVDNIIVITANSKTDVNKDDSNNKRSSIAQSKVKQSVKIPRDINPEEITTSLENGILSITVPRNKEVKSAKKIEIN